MHNVARTLMAMGMLCGMSSMALAQDFKPFSNVKDVCPACPKPTTDVITLDNNTKIRAKVVAENVEFMVIVRYGEVRVVLRRKVESVSWGDGSKSAGLTSQDQLVLNNGHVLTGSITEEKDTPSAYFRMQSGVNKQTYVIFKSQVAKAYKAGSVYTFKRPTP